MSAPKQLAKRQKLERKRRRKREAGLKRQKRRQTGWYPSDGLGPVDFVRGPVGGLKMSEVLQDFVAPYVASTLDGDSLGQLFSMAQVAWNIALEPEYCHEAMIDDALDEHLNNPTSLEREGCRESLCRLVERKLESFAKYQRPIMAFQLDELDDGGYYLSVASGLLC